MNQIILMEFAAKENAFVMRELWRSSVGSRSAGLLQTVGTRLRAVRALTCVLALVTWSAATAAAQNAMPSRQAVEQWLTQNANAKPDFNPGDVLTVKDLNRIRPF